MSLNGSLLGALPIRHCYGLRFPKLFGGSLHFPIPPSSLPFFFPPSHFLSSESTEIFSGSCSGKTIESRDKAFAYSVLVYLGLSRLSD